MLRLYTEDCHLTTEISEAFGEKVTEAQAGYGYNEATNKNKQTKNKWR
jgi:hypothetical protein